MVRKQLTAIDKGRFSASWEEIAPRKASFLWFIVIIGFDRLCDVQAEVAEFEA